MSKQAFGRRFATYALAFVIPFLPRPLIVSVNIYNHMVSLLVHVEPGFVNILRLGPSDAL
jgi:hypothetical protein